MLEAKNLSCIRDERILFQGISFCVQQGEIVQVEGVNGAGKTSLLRILAGLSQPDEGDVDWLGKNIRHYRERYNRILLFLGHQSGVKSLLTPFENLSFYWPVRQNTNAIWQALADVGLAGYENLPVAQLSDGQRRRVALARLWLSDALLWVLDEPLTAIDKQGRQVLIKLFERHVSLGGMLLLTTHQELDDIAQTVKIIRLAGVQRF